MLMHFALHGETERLALLHRDADGGLWIELRTLAGRALGEIAADYLPLAAVWSPDGASLAFGSNDGRLYLYRLGAAAPQLIFADPALQAGFCQWAADGSRLVFSAYAKANNRPPKIYSLALDTGHTLQLTHETGTVDRFPQWSPSGERVAFQRQFLDEPELPTRIYVAEVQSGRCFPVPNTSDGNSRVGRHCWSPDSASLLLTVAHPTRTQVRVIRLQDGASVWSYESEKLQSGVFSPHGDRILCVDADELLWFAYPEGTLLHRLALASRSVVGHSSTGPQIGFGARATTLYFLGSNACLYCWDIGGECAPVLESSPPVRPAFTHEAYEVASQDGRPIPVQRFIPPKPRAPAILFVHGGPGEAIDPDDPVMLRLLAEGVEFVCAAYRGSSGHGPEHQAANRGEYGRADVWDVVAAGRDWQKRTGAGRPLLVAGYSYGGFLTLLALAQADHPFAGGIAMWTLSGLHRLSLHQQRAFPVEAEQLALARVERSPLAQASRMRGPLLILHGALDTTATTEELQSIQADIVSHGGECALIVYPDDTHGLWRHRDDLHAAMLGFLKRYE